MNFEEKVGLPLLKKLITRKNLVNHQVSSYNYFVNSLLGKTIEKSIENTNKENEEKGVILSYKGFFMKREVPDGQEYLQACLSRNLTYNVQIWVKLEIKSDTEEKSKKISLLLFQLPIMIGSQIDNSAKKPINGYFIIRGGQKAVIYNEQTTPNKIFYKTGQSVSEDVTLYYSGSESYKFLYKVYSKKDDYLLTFQPLKTEVPLLPLIKYLGISDLQIYQSFKLINFRSKTSFLAIISKWAEADIEAELTSIWSKNQTPEYGVKRLHEILDNYLLPTFGADITNRRTKGQFLLKMLVNHLNSPKERNLDYKDYLSFKRLKTIGELFDEKIRLLLVKSFTDFGESITKKLRKKTQVFQALFKTIKVTNGLLSSISTGSWVGGRNGLNQIIEKTNTIATLSNLRKVFNSTSKLTRGNVRDVNPSYWGRYCPLETSLSTTCGLLKFLALGSSISTSRDIKSLEAIIFKEITIVEEEELATATIFYLDGKRFLIKEKIEHLLSRFKILKRKIDFSVYIEEGQLYVDSSLGRISRAVLVLPTTEKQKKDLISYYQPYLSETLEVLIRKGIIEYLEYSEEKTSKIALTSAVVTSADQYLEIHGILTYGLSSNLVPYFNHNSASKTCFGGRMIKQAVSNSSVEEILSRYDTKRYHLISNQKPLVYSEVENSLDIEPYGENIVVAIATLEGRNIEDSIILNKDSVEKGLLEINYYKTQSKEKFFQDDFYEKVYLPPEKEGLPAYSILDHDGLPSVNKMIQEDKVVISRNTFANTRAGTMEDIDNSVEVIGRPNQYVSSVNINRSESGSLLYRLKTCSNVPLGIGEKVASRCGQKGIISSLIPGTDLPFTRNGIKPDLLFTPHGIFSRMTFGHLLEMIAGKVAALKGKRIPSTAFSTVIQSEEELREMLLKSGLSDDGTEQFYNGKTGEKIKTKLFSGIIYYMRLYHLAMEKIHARDYGPVHLLTLQPTEGKSREGGLRFGEMERDSILGYGGSKIIKDRLEIDTISALVCKTCNGMVDERSFLKKCNLCNSKDVGYCRIPYSFYLLRNELFSMGMSINIELE